MAPQCLPEKCLLQLQEIRSDWPLKKKDSKTARQGSPSGFAESGSVKSMVIDIPRSNVKQILIIRRLGYPAPLSLPAEAVPARTTQNRIDKSNQAKNRNIANGHVHMIIYKAFNECECRWFPLVGTKRYTQRKNQKRLTHSTLLRQPNDDGTSSNHDISPRWS